jgi:hypothetical protein
MSAAFVTFKCLPGSGSVAGTSVATSTAGSGPLQGWWNV